MGHPADASSLLTRRPPHRLASRAVDANWRFTLAITVNALVWLALIEDLARHIS